MESISFHHAVTWRNLFVLFLAFSILLSSPLPSRAAAPGTQPPQANEESATELNKKLTNPVSSIWSLSFQQNNYYLSNPPGAWNSDLQFQPVMPVALTRDWNLITRPVFQLFNSTPFPQTVVNPVSHQPTVEMNRTTGFGDTILLEMLSPSPNLVGNWILGVGPTFIFPTASDYWTGQGKFQAGPGVVVGYLSQKWILGAFVQDWASFAGQSSRPDTSQMNLQPIAAYFFGEGWSIGYSGNILANWKGDSGNIWTVPVGLGINKVVKLGRLPIKLGIAGQCMPVHPDSFGQQWNIQVQVTPVIPKLISGTLFE